MSEQTEAQRLASALAASYSNDEHLVHAAAAELRRLDAANAELLVALKQVSGELHACQAVIHLAGGFDTAYVRDAQAALSTASAAIAKHGGPAA